MGQLTKARALGDIFLTAAFGKAPPTPNYRAYLFAALQQNGRLTDAKGWTETLRQGGIFEPEPPQPPAPGWKIADGFADLMGKPDPPPGAEPVVLAAPSIRYLDGRGANRPWLSEIPDPLSQVAWQSPVWAHPDTLATQKVSQGEVLRLETRWGKLEAPVYATYGVRPGVLVMGRGQGHLDYGRYARERGANPMRLMPPATEKISGGGLCAATLVSLLPTGRKMALAHTDGSRTQHGRKIAVTVSLKAVGQDASAVPAGLTMWSFPLTLPLPEGYDRHRDVYPPHEHQDYRWAMIVDLDRCVGCGACVAACYAENNLGIVGEEQILAGREMSWIRIERYLDPEHPERVTFLPMLCQHCDNAPCESVCPVYAPHHSKEGLNNQIYNRCIGTRFCSQNCPYKVRRFNWFTWQWPKPLDLQLNPEVTVRSKGVMEKCSFCVQRIKHAHDTAKDENRSIRDGEIQPACLQTCPTGVFTFGNLMDPQSRVRRMVADRRAYQVLGYLNTKPAVIYLKKVVQEV